MALIKPDITPPPVGGTFPATIRGTEVRTSQAGNNYVSVKLQVEQGDNTYTSFGRAMASGKAKWQLPALLRAAGLPEEAARAAAGEEIDTDILVGARLTVVTEPEISEKDGNTYLNTKNFLPLNGAA